MPRRRARPYTALKVVCEPADGETISAHDGEVQILLTLFGADVKRGRAEIRSKVEEAAKAPIDGAYIRKVVEAASVAVRRVRALGVKQGASLAIAYVTPTAGEVVCVNYFALGDCSVWLVRPGEARQQPAVRRTYLGELGAKVGGLVPDTPGQFLVDPTAGEAAVLAPAHYRVAPPPPPRALATLLAVAATVLAAAILLFWALPGLKIALAAISTSAPSPSPAAAAMAAQTITPLPVTPTPGSTGTPLTVTAVPSAAPPSAIPRETPVPPVVSLVGEGARATQVAKITDAFEATETERARREITPVPPSTVLPTASLAIAVVPTPDAAAPILSSTAYGVRLDRPNDGDTGAGSIVFSWNPGGPLPLGYQYELIFSNLSGDVRLSPVGAGDATSAKVDLDAKFLEPAFRQLLNGGTEFCWGVRAWNSVGRSEAGMVSEECRRFVYNTGKKSSSPPTVPATPTAREKASPIPVPTKP